MLHLSSPTTTSYSRSISSFPPAQLENRLWFPTNSKSLLRVTPMTPCAKTSSNFSLDSVLTFRSCRVVRTGPRRWKSLLYLAVVPRHFQVQNGVGFFINKSLCRLAWCALIRSGGILGSVRVIWKSATLHCTDGCWQDIA